ncbi:hypothetical protein EBB06_12245 [Crenobacter cavernae]|uniref:Uncharacterized protein n=2 Tax=Crenobacter cavernae TaxID=2290923 RepID=A0ABY0FCZ4_9NEIS|nr:hypothetical protein EBB06_12245 [Crenobacter cavernae]
MSYTDLLGTIYQADQRAADPSDNVAVMTGFYAALDQLRAGECHPDGLMRLMEMNVTLAYSADLIVQRGTPETKALGHRVGQVSMKAAPALQALSERFANTRRIVARAEELQALRDVANTLDAVTQALTRGELLTVMRKAADVVEEATAEQRRKEAA